MTTAPPINLAAALDRLGCDLAIFRQFAAAVPLQISQDYAVINDCLQQISDLAYPLQAAAAKPLKKAAHRLKGTLAMLGAECAQRACHTLETADEQTSSADLYIIINGFDVSLAALTPALDDLLNGHGS